MSELQRTKLNKVINSLSKVISISEEQKIKLIEQYSEFSEQEIIKDFTIDNDLVIDIVNTYIISYKNLTTTIKVNGYKVETENPTTNNVIALNVTYPQESVLVGNKFDVSKLSIEIIREDGSVENINYNELTMKPNDIIVSQIGWNEYIVGYEDVTTILKVHGYGENSIIANYVGKDIEVGHNYDKEDVKVTLIYTPNLNGNIKEDVITNFTLNSLLVEKVGNNTFVVSYNNFVSEINVVGYENKIVDDDNDKNDDVLEEDKVEEDKVEEDNNETNKPSDSEKDDVSQGDNENSSNSNSNDISSNTNDNSNTTNNNSNTTNNEQSNDDSNAVSTNDTIPVIPIAGCAITSLIGLLVSIKKRKK